MTRGRTILFAWELGAGLGHVRDLLRVADALAARGHRPVLALREVTKPWGALRGRPWPVLPAPHAITEAGPEPMAHTFADILGACGFATADALAPLVRQWDGLLDVVQPDLVVLHYAPSLILATTGRVPAIDIGNGFCQPPCHVGSFPPLMPEAGTTPRFAEDKLLAAVTEVQAARGVPIPATLPASFAGPERCVTVLPELDPYHDSRIEVVVGSLQEPIVPQQPGTGHGYFAYLNSAVASTEPALLLLARAGFPGETYVHGATAELRQRLREAGLVVHDRPPSLGEVLTRAAVLVHQSSLRTAEAGLMAGRPQLLFPENLEHLLTATALHRLGVAHYLTGTFPAADVVEGMRQLMQVPRFASRAAEVAAGLARSWRADPLLTVVARCEAMLEQD